MKKRWLALLMTIAICLSMLPGVTLAADTPQLWFQPMVEDETGKYAVTDKYLSALSLTFGEELCGVFYYGTADSMEPVKEEDLQASNTVRIRQRKETTLADAKWYSYAVRLDLISGGNEYYVTYENVRFDVEPVLPDIGLYKDDERSTENYLLETLGYGPTSYLLAAPGCTITNIVVDEGEDSFLSFDLSDDKTMATVTLGAGYDADARYNLTIEYTANGESKAQGLSFEVVDLSTPYLKAYGLNRSNNVNYINFSNENVAIEGALDDDDRWAVYFVDGYEEEPIAVNNLEFPTNVVKVEQQSEHESFFRLYYIAPTDAANIKYKSGDNVYQLPLTIELPNFGFYSKPVATVENYVGSELPFNGSKTDENSNVYEEYYVVSCNGETITTIEPEDGEYMPFFSCEAVEGYPAAMKVIIEDGFETGQNYGIVVYHGDNDDQWVNFSVQDMRSQLYMASPDREDDLYFESEELELRTRDEFALGNILNEIFYFGTPDNLEKIPLNELTLSGPIEMEGIEQQELEDGLHGFAGRISGTDFGIGTVSYTVEDVEYTVSFQVGLPNFGLYSEKTASEDAYVETLVYSNSNPKDYYLICTNNSYTIQDIICEEAEDYVTFDKVATNCWKVSLSKGFVSGEDYRVVITSLRSNGNKRTDRFWCTIVDKSPSLTFHRLIWDGEQYTVDTANIRYSENMTTAKSIRGVFYYGPVGEAEPVKVSALTFEDITAAAWSDAALDDRLGGYAVELSASELGKATVSYESLDFIIAVTEREYEGKPGYDGTGFYTSLDKETCFKVEDASGYPGDPVELYFVWDSDDGIPKTITATLEAQKEGTVFKDLDISDDDTLAALADYDIHLTLAEDHIRLNTTIGNPRDLLLKVHYEDDTHWERLELNLKYYQWGNHQDNPTINIDGVDYTFGIGDIRDDEYLSFLGAGSGFGGWDPYLVIVTGYETGDEQPVSAAVYNAIVSEIEDLTYKITDYYNTTGTQETCNLSLSEIAYREWHGYSLPYVEVITTPGAGVEAKMVISFTYNGESYSMVYRPGASADMQDNFYLDASALDTAEKLNAVLSSKAALLNWFEKNDPEQYKAYCKNFASGLTEMSNIYLELPDVKYEKLIIVSVPGIDLHLHGHEDGTTMPGMRILRNRYPVYVNDIDFVANANITQTYGKEAPFTCGVLAARAKDINSSAAGDARIGNCTFTGFDYGVRSTDDGYATLNGECQFFGCGVGYQLDCENKSGGNGNEGMDNCFFYDCGTAVKFLSLPDGFWPYYWRVFECDFVDNDVDFHVEHPGTFYFYRNFFGTVKPGKTLNETKVATDILSRVPVVATKDGVNAITNPRYILSYVWLGFTDDNFLSIDSARETIIINEEADNLVMDTEKLAEELANTEQPVTIGVIDEEKEQVQATWTIN